MSATRKKAPEFTHHREIARRLGVDAKTVSRWARAGKIPSPRFTAGTLHFYRSADVECYFSTGQWPKGDG